MARLDNQIIMETIELSGSGKRFDELFNVLPSAFSMMSDNENQKLKVYIGEDPDLDVNIWIRSPFSHDVQRIINQLKKDLRSNRNLEMIGIENLNLIEGFPDFHFIMARDEVLKTFQTSQDLNNFLIERFRLNLAI